MIYFALKWFIAVGGSWLLILYGISIFGLDRRSVFRSHFLFLCFLSFGIAAMTVYAAEKPPTPPGPGPGPNPPSVTNIYFKAGMKPGNVVVPYQTPLKEIQQ